MAEVHLDQGLATEDVDEDFELEVVGVDFGDLAGEVGEGSFLDPHGLALFVGELRLATWCVGRGVGLG